MKFLSRIWAAAKEIFIELGTGLLIYIVVSIILVVIFLVIQSLLQLSVARFI